MKLTNIVEEGICGINVELTTFDRFTIAASVKQYDEFNKHLEADKAWENKRNEECKGMKWDEREKWQEANPRPVYNGPAPQDIANTWYIFMKKLTPNMGYVSNVFTEEKGE